MLAVPGLACSCSNKEAACSFVDVCVCVFVCAGTMSNCAFAVGIALFGLLGFCVRPWRTLAATTNSPGVLFFLLAV